MTICCEDRRFGLHKTSLQWVRISMLGELYQVLHEAEDLTADETMRVVFKLFEFINPA